MIASAEDDEIAPTWDDASDLIKTTREIYEDTHYFIMIDCPEHLTHKVKLYTQGNRYAGVWECDETDEGISDSCPHTDVEVEEIEVDDSHPDRQDGYTTSIYVCVLCGVQVEGDPDESFDCD